MVDIIHAFQEKYEDITLITGDLNLRNNKLPEKVKLARIIPPKRSSTGQRLFTWLLGFFQIFWHLLRQPSTAELFIVSNPPLTVFLPLFFRNKFTLLIFDVYPDALHEHKLIKPKSLIYKVWSKTNKKVFKQAKRIFTLTEGMKNKVAQYVESENILVVPVWTDTSFLSPLKRSKNKFIKQHGLEDKFVIMYSGNLGLAHNIEVLVELAQNLNQEFEVVIIGEGAKKQKLKKRIQSAGLSNCRLLSWQSMEMFPHSFSAAHLGVVSLGNEVSALSIPSKTFDLMAIGVPVLCIAGEDTEVAQLIKKYDIGRTFGKDNLRGMLAYMKKLKDDTPFYRKLATNSKGASKEFTSDNAKSFVI